MAFTEAQLLKIVRITGVHSDLLTDVLTLNTAAITAEVISQAGDLILEYFPASGTGAGRNFTDINPNIKNLGASIQTERSRAIIKKELADLLYLTEFVSSGSSLVRG